VPYFYTFVDCRVTRRVCEKNAQKIFPTHVKSKLIQKPELCIKVALSFGLTSVIFEKLPKENNQPKGENSTTLATLFDCL
jgi:hypothetical protein